MCNITYLHKIHSYFHFKYIQRMSCLFQTIDHSVYSKATKPNPNPILNGQAASNNTINGSYGYHRESTKIWTSDVEDY